MCWYIPEGFTCTKCNPYIIAFQSRSRRNCKYNGMCQLFESGLSYSLASQHLSSEASFLCLLPRACMGKVQIYLLWLHNTSLSTVLIISLSLSIDIVWFAKKPDNSILFSSIRRNSFHFPGIALDSSTRLLIPFPLLDLVSALRLSGRYTSHMISSHSAFLSWASMYGKKTFAAPGFSIFTIAVPSTMITSTAGLAMTFAFWGIRCSEQCTRSDFVPDLIVPSDCDRDGGCPWFSCLKNSTRSPLRIWQEMYSLEMDFLSLLWLRILQHSEMQFVHALILRDGGNLRPFFCPVVHSNLKFYK